MEKLVSFSVWFLMFVILLFPGCQKKPEFPKTNSPEQWVNLLAEPEVAIADSAQTVIKVIGQSAVPYLVDLLAHGRHRYVRERAALTLGALGPAAEDATDALVEALSTDRSPKVRQFSARALLAIGAPARRHLQALAAIADSDSVVAVRLTATIGLEILDSTSAILEPVYADLLLSESDPELRCLLAALSLKHRGGDSVAIATLSSGIVVRDATMGRFVMQTLEAAGRRARPALPAILRFMVSDPILHSENRVRDVLDLYSTDHNKNLGVLFFCGRALKAICGSSLDSLITAQTARLGDPNSLMDRLSAGRILRGIGEPAVVQVLSVLYGHCSVTTRSMAIWVLAGMPTREVSVAQAIASRGLADDDVAIRLSTALALRAMGVRDDVLTKTLLAAMQSDPDEGIRQFCAMAVASTCVDTAAAVRALEECIRHQAFWSAADALGQLGCGAHAAVPLLVEVAQSSSNDDLRASAINSLGMISCGDSSAISLLLHLLRDPDRNVRTHALKGLQGVEDLDRVFGITTVRAVQAVLNEELNRSPHEGRSVDLMVAALGVLGKCKESAGPIMPDVVEALLSSMRGAVEIFIPEFSRRSTFQVPDPDPVESALAAALCDLGPSGIAGIKRVTKGLRDRDRMVRRRALLILQALGHKAANATPEVTRILKSEKDPKTRAIAARTVGAISLDTRSAISALRSAISDTS